MSGNYLFFQGQGIVREFHDVSGKNEILPNVRELSGKFAIPVMNAKKRAVLIFGIQAKLF